MLEPEAVSAILRLSELGWGSKRISRELGISRNTVKEYLAAGGWTPYQQPERKKALDGLETWLRERLRRHRGNADVLRQELAIEKAIAVSLRTVERAVKPYRQELEAEARATVRFETPPGKQMQIDFGERLVEIGGAKLRVYLFVATLGYSRRSHIRAFRNERQESWFDGLESAFTKFGGVTEEVLFDNPRALVVEHDAATRTVVFNEKLKAFAKHWGFVPRACAPYRARTKGKIENGIGYVKRNAIAGRSFPSWEVFEAHLEAWAREVADVRVHGTTGEAPIERFRRAEATALKSIAGIPPFHAARELIRRVQADCAVEIDGNAYSVPWRLISETVRATITDGIVRIYQEPRGGGPCDVCRSPAACHRSRTLPGSGRIQSKLCAASRSRGVCRQPAGRTAAVADRI
jgi:transposase